MNIRQNLFGQGPKAGRAAGGYDRPPAPPPRDDQPMGGYDDRGGYGDPSRSNAAYGGQPGPTRQSQPMRSSVGRQPSSPARKIQLRIAKVEDKTLANQYIFGNL
jgi:vesicle-fusing ATPase